MLFPEIAKCMAIKNMNQKDLASILSITPQSIGRKLNGKVDFRRNEMVRIKEHFKDIAPDITMDELFKIFYPFGS